MKIFNWIFTIIGVVLLMGLIGGIVYISINGIPAIPPIKNPFDDTTPFNPTVPDDNTTTENTTTACKIIDWKMEALC